MKGVSRRARKRNDCYADHTVIDRDYIAERLREAAETIRGLPLPKYGKPGQPHTALPEPVRDYWDAYGRSAAGPTRLKPGPKCIARLDEVLEWLWWIPCPRDRKVVWGVASQQRPYGRFIKVAKFDGRHRDTIKAVWDRECDRIAARLVLDTNPTLPEIERDFSVKLTTAA